MPKTLKDATASASCSSHVTAIAIAALSAREREFLSIITAMNDSSQIQALYICQTILGQQLVDASQSGRAAQVLQFPKRTSVTARAKKPAKQQGASA